MTEPVHLVVPHTLRDPQHPSGGNRYDRELADGLRSLGHQVSEHLVRGSWTSPDDDFAMVLAGLPDGATVLVDGLVGLAAGVVLGRERDRLRPWLLVHLPLELALPGSPAQEQQALTAATGVITTSDWTRRWLLEAYGLEPARVWMARPGVHPSALSNETSRGGALLTVGAVVPDKGHDVLVDALADLTDLPWSCRVVGPLDRDPAFVDRLRRQVRRSGLQDRIRFDGPLSPAEVSAAYGASDLFVLPTRLEMYGMVLTEALAHGLPVVASDTGGVAEAVGAVWNGVEHDGAVPGVLVPPSDVDALSTALRGWLQDPGRREQLRIAARARRTQLPDWSSTARSVEAALRVTVVNQTQPLNVVRAKRVTLTSGGPAVLAARRSLGRVRSVACFVVAGLVLGVLVFRLGAGPFLRAFDRITIGSLMAALLVTGVTTLCAAWRWTWVARRLGLRLDVRAAVAAYYRSQLLNQVLPGGVLGDVDRAVRHGDREAALGMAARAVAWERTLGQVGLVSLTLLAAVALPSALRGTVAWLTLAGLGVLAVVAVLVLRLAGPVRRSLHADLRRLATGGPWLAVVLSVAAAAGHLLVLLVALRTTGVDVPTLRAVPLLLVVLVASSLPTNIAGWGPREGVAAWVFAAAGLGAAEGVTVAAVYGILTLVAASPGALVLTLDVLLRRIGVGSI